MRIEIRGMRLPGIVCGEHEHVHVGVQRGREVVDLHRGDAAEARWTVDVEAVQSGDGHDFRGPYVHGSRGQRFLYLSWGSVNSEGSFTMFRRAKLLCADIDPEMMHRAVASESALAAQLELTAKDGSPRAGSVRPPDVQWSVLPP